jgi:hypothetical protein
MYDHVKLPDSLAGAMQSSITLCLGWQTKKIGVAEYQSFKVWNCRRMIVRRTFQFRYVLMVFV